MNQNYLMTLGNIANALDEIDQPLKTAQSKAIAQVLGITQQRNDVVDQIDAHLAKPDALHTGYRAPKKTEPQRADFTSSDAYNKAQDRWAENQR